MSIQKINNTDFTKKSINKAWNLLKSNSGKKAELILLKIYKKNPKDFNILINLGAFYLNLKKNDLAINFLEKAKNINPSIEQTHFYLGISFTNILNFDQAINCYKNVLKINPKSIHANLNIGNIFKIKDDYKNAILHYEKVLILDPQNIASHNNLAVIYRTKKNYDLSIKYYQKAIGINPNSAEIYYNLGILYKEINEFEKSEESYLKGHEIDKNNTKILNNLGHLYFDLLDFEKSINYYQKAILSNPNDFNSNSNYLVTLSYLYNNEEYLSNAINYSNNIPKLKINEIYNLNTSNEQIIKIGLVSGDFRNHPVGYFLLDFIKYLKQKNVKIFGYYNNNINDNLTSLLKDNFNVFKNIYNTNDNELINIIQKDEIEILFDLSGYSSNSRLPIFKNRCTPIQASWGGWAASTGLKEIDYIIGDPYATPNSDQKNYTEKIYQLNNIWECLSTSNIDTKIEFNNNKNLYFGSMNSVFKMNNIVIKTWSKILNQIPKSKLILKHNTFNKSHIRKKIMKLFLQENVKPEKLIIESGSPRSELFSLYNKIDIALDTFPYNGGTTSFEASLMAVPLLTMINESVMFRCGESFNNNLNMKEWIAENEKDYIDKALDFSNNKEKLIQLKKELKDKVVNNPLFDSKKFADDFYQMLVKIKK